MWFEQYVSHQQAVKKKKKKMRRVVCWRVVVLQCDLAELHAGRIIAAPRGVGAGTAGAAVAQAGA